MTTRARFRRMDEATAEDWAIIRERVWETQPEVAERVLAMLEGLAQIEEGFAVNQLVHATQTATRAERAGASEELVLAALCHDIGKALSSFGHAAIGAAILRPYVSDDVHWLLTNHQLIQGRHYVQHFGGDPEAWRALEEHPMFETAWRFVEEWDQASFDPDYPTLPLEHFAPLVRRALAKPRDRR